jgi:hypothetical protein
MRQRLLIAVLLLGLASVVGCSDNSNPQAGPTTIEETAPSPTQSVATELVGSWHKMRGRLCLGVVGLRLRAVGARRGAVTDGTNHF